MDYSWDMEGDDAVPLCGSYSSERDRAGCISANWKKKVSGVLNGERSLVMDISGYYFYSEMGSKPLVMLFFFSHLTDCITFTG